MRIIKRYISVLLIIIVVWESAMNSSKFVAAQEIVLSQPVKEALSRFAALKTFAVTWTHQYQSGEPGRDKHWSESRVHYLVWQDGKMYTRCQEGQAWTDAPKGETAFNGQILANGYIDQKSPNGKPKSPGIIINLAENEQPDAEYFEVEPLQSLGIHLPRGISELLRMKYLQSHLVFLLEQDGRLKAVEQSQIDGRPMTRIALLADNPLWGLLQREDLTRTEKILRRNPYATEEQIQQKLAEYRQVREVTPRRVEYRFYLDPEFSYTVRRWQELTEDGKLQGQADCTDHVKLPGHEIWLPRKCRIAAYISLSFPRKIFKTPYRTDEIEVSKFDTKTVPDELFTLKYTTPGTEVTDRTLPEAKLAPGADVGLGGVTYRIPAKPEDLDRAIEKARAITNAQAEYSPSKARARRNDRRRIALLVVSTVILIGGIVYFIVRYRRKAARS